MRISNQLPNLLGGISQQPAAVRFENQLEEAENAYPSFTEGMRKRCNSTHVGELMQTPGGHKNVKFHIIDRDDDERYLVVLANLTVRVFDLSNGNELTVLKPDGPGYLTTSGSNQNYEVFKAVTVADVTYIVNTEEVVEMDSATSTERDDECLIFVKNPGGQKTIYTISGDLDAQYISNDSTVTGYLFDQRSNAIAQHLLNNPSPGTPPAGTSASTGLQQDAGWGTGSFSGSQVGSTIWVHRSTGGAFNLDVWDSRSETLMEYISVAGGVNAFTSLPAIAPNGFKTVIKGVPEEDVDDYWVKFTAEDGTFSSGKWEETIKPGIEYQLDYDTMPHLLIRSSDTDVNGPIFVFMRADGQTPAGPAAAGDDYSEFIWLDRVVGDTSTNPNPSFVGKTINNVFFAKNRLGFLSGENVILSEAGEFFNFWRITTAALLDTAPIDLSSPAQGVTEFRSAAAFQDRIVLFSGSAQFSLQGDPILTPNTAAITQTSEYESTFIHVPASADNSLFFPFKRGSVSSGVREYRLLDPATESFAADDITSHVASLITGDVSMMSVDTVEGLLSVVDSDGGLYIYRWLNSGRGERQLSAWVKLTFGDSCLVRAAHFVDTELFVFVDRPVTGGDYELFFEKIEFKSVLPDDENGAAFRTLLDRRIDESGATSITYAAGPDETTIVLPYRRVDREIAVMSRNDGVDTEGTVYTINTQPPVNGTNVIVDGDVTGQPLWIGEKYPFKLTLSEQFARFSDVVRTDGRFQIQQLHIGFGPNTVIQVDTVHDSGPTYSLVLRSEGISVTLTNEVTFKDNRITVPIRGRSSELQIDLQSNEPYPSAVYWVNVIGEFVTTMSQV